MRHARVPRKRIAQTQLRSAALMMLTGMTDERFARRDDVLTSLQRSCGLHPAEAVAAYEHQALIRAGRAPMGKWTSPELDIQVSFRAQLRYVAPGVVCVAIPNGARRTQWQALQAKKEGLSAGFPDVMCLWDGGVCWIEFKQPGCYPNPNQREWLNRLERFGFVAGVARSVEEALAILRRAGAPVLERAA